MVFGKARLDHATIFISQIKNNGKEILHYTHSNNEEFLQN